MQIPIASSAASAAGIAAQSTSKDSVSQGSQASDAAKQAQTIASVEQSGSANPDRDAQGQGDGLPDETGGERASRSDFNDVVDIDADQNESSQEQQVGSEPNIDPPNHLDIIA